MIYYKLTSFRLGITRNTMKQPRFSIHDAFEEENDEAIRVYVSTVISNVPKPSSSGAVNSNVGYTGNNTTTSELTCDPRSV